MAKDNNLIIRIVLIAALVMTGMFFENKYDLFSVIGQDSSISIDAEDIVVSVCQDTINEFTLGAQAGECYMYTLGNEKSIRYVNSIVEKGPTAGPTGPRYTCTYDVGNPSDTKICKDGKIKISPNQTINYCNQDSECNGYACTNHYCSNNPVGYCETVNQRKCYSFSQNNNQFQVCQSNNRWSGIQTCGTGLVCSNGNCIVPIPVCTIANWKETLSACQPNNTQIKTWTKIGNCENGVTKPSTETVSCSYPIPSCTSFTYSDWSNCTQQNVQTRTLISSNPSGCSGGESPLLSKACTYVPPSNGTTGGTTGNNTGNGTTGGSITCAEGQTNLFGSCIASNTLLIILGVIVGLILLVALGKK